MTKGEKIASYIIWTILLSLLIWAIVNHFKIQRMFDDPRVKKSITTGVITDFNPGAKTCSDFEYKFYVKGKEFEGSYDIVTKLGQKSGDELREFIGRKFKVWYVLDDPIYSKLLIKKPVNDSIPLN